MYIYKTYKVPLKLVLKDVNILDTINNKVYIIDKLVTKTLLFLKLYILYVNKNQLDYPIINTNFIDTIFKVLSSRSKNGRSPSEANQLLFNQLNEFYVSEFKPLESNISEELIVTHLNTVLDYAATSIVTDIENTIKANFVTYIETYINAYFNKKFLMKNMTKEQKSNFCYQLKLIKNDVLSYNSELKSNVLFHNEINEWRNTLVPQNIQKSIAYDVKVRPLEYLPFMLYITSFLESKEIKMKNIVPLRTSCIPKHMALDSTTLVHLFYDVTTKDIPLIEENKDYKIHIKGSFRSREILSKKELEKLPKEQQKILKKENKDKEVISQKIITKTELLNGNLTSNIDQLWSLYFDLSKIKNNKNYEFDGMIKTDGISFCALYKLKNSKDTSKYLKEGTTLNIESKTKETEIYLDEVPKDTIEKIKNKRYVVIDPNMADLLYCVSDDEKHLRYTQNSRRKTRKTKKYNKIRKELKEKYTIDDNNIITLETELSSYNHKTVNYELFKNYIAKKIEINSKIYDFYTNIIFRKLKLHSFYNNIKSEQNFMTRFKETYGSPKDVIISIGDWEQKNNMKFKEPVKGKGLRSMLRKFGYNVYLLNESCTSIRCSNCKDINANLETFRKRIHPNKKLKIREETYVNGLLTCPCCKSLWNRDVNACFNDLEIVKSILNYTERPLYLEKSNSIRVTSYIKSI